MKNKKIKNCRKLDNMAKLFSLDSKNNTNTFRYSVILKEKIDGDKLLTALNHSLSVYPDFKVKMKTGFFWSHLEYNEKEINTHLESGISCKRIDFKENNDYLFKVTYYNNRINIDVFHALTDGIGALILLKSIIKRYLDLKYNLLESYRDNKVSSKDEYLNNFNRKLKTKPDTQTAFQIPGKLTEYNNTSHYTVKIDEIIKVAKSFEVTITEILTAMYIYAMYLSIFDKRKNEIIIMIPIDLRNYYEATTLNNFFTVMNINPKIIKNKLSNFKEILESVHNEFRNKLNTENVESYLTRDVKLGLNIPIQLIPLFIKKFCINKLAKVLGKYSTSTLSNVGIIDFEEKYKKYIDNILASVVPGRVQKIKCTICSFNNKLNITINSNIFDREFETTFYSLLKSHVKNVKRESNTKI